MVAPLASSAVIPVHGFAPFEVGQDGVTANPVDHFVRSFWAYDVNAVTLQDVVASMRRVATVKSNIEDGGGVLPTAGAPDVGVVTNGNEPPRVSRQSTRFAYVRELFDDNNQDYNENALLAIIAAVPGTVTAESFVQLDPSLSIDSLVLPVPQAGDLDFRGRAFNGEDVTGDDIEGGWVITGVPGTLAYNGGNAYAALIFTTDGSDGNAPQPLALGRSLEQQLEYIDKNPGGLFLGWLMGGGDAPTWVTASIAHSKAMVNG